MVRTYKKLKQGGRKSYSNSQEMKDACSSVLNKEMSINQASKHFRCDRRALSKRVNGELSVDSHPGRKTVLTSQQEKELSECLILMADWGWGFTRGEVKDLIQDFLKTNSIDTPFIDSRPSKDWLHAFLQRNPKITPRKTEHLSNSRNHAENPETIKIWFDLVEKTLKNAGIINLPSQIFNSDESGFITDPKEQIVLAKRGASRVSQSIGGSGREQITVNCACSASGHILPPYIIYKGKNLYMDWVKGGPDGAVYTTSSKGWMECPHFLEWFQSIFLMYTKHLANRPRVLIFDGHISHISSPLIDMAK
ncbi:uncharacterized protein LOC124807481 isoform X2 [Hydra vulgaris]|uniref:Uncharacterized protein LOC124807481 isoform X2 n=1 Tax=Hydra vulgaris TaxID=6087 RepID=A0ABM4DMK0_HYDVU